MAGGKPSGRRRLRKGRRQITVVAGSLRKLRPSLTSAPIYIRLKNVIGFPATWVRENEEICQRPKWRIRRLFNRCENSLRGRRPFSLFNSKKEHFQFRRCRQRDTHTRNRKERSFCTRSMNQKLYLFSLYANETARIQKGERERDCEFLKRGNKLKRVVSFFIATIDHLENSINIFSLHKFSFFFSGNVRGHLHAFGQFTILHSEAPEVATDD